MNHGYDPALVRGPASIREDVCESACSCALLLDALAHGFKVPRSDPVGVTTRTLGWSAKSKSEHMW